MEFFRGFGKGWVVILGFDLGSVWVFLSVLIYWIVIFFVFVIVIEFICGRVFIIVGFE